MAKPQKQTVWHVTKSTMPNTKVACSCFTRNSADMQNFRQKKIAKKHHYQHNIMWEKIRKRTLTMWTEIMNKIWRLMPTWDWCMASIDYYYNRFTTLCLGLLRWMINHSGFCWSRHDGVAVASAEQYACTSLQKHQQLTTQIITGCIPFLTPNQQCQRLNGKYRENNKDHAKEYCQKNALKSLLWRQHTSVQLSKWSKPNRFYCVNSFHECCSRCGFQPYDCVIIRFVE